MMFFYVGDFTGFGTSGSKAESSLQQAPCATVGKLSEHSTTASFFLPSPRKFTNIRQKPYSQNNSHHDHNNRGCPKTAKYVIWSCNPRSKSTSCQRDAAQTPGDAPAAPPDPW
jgi:hypothetical protein